MRTVKFRNHYLNDFLEAKQNNERLDYEQGIQLMFLVRAANKVSYVPVVVALVPYVQDGAFSLKALRQ